MSDLQQAAKWIRDHGGRVTVTLFQHGRGLKSPQRAEWQLQQLAAAGIGRLTTERGVTVFRLHRVVTTAAGHLRA